MNDADGLEQGFTIGERPAGAEGGGALCVELSVEGDLVASAKSDREVCFTYGNGRAVLSYDKLCVLDARGWELPARFVVASVSVAIHVDDSDAAYPVVIDPTVTQVAKLLASDGAATDYFGRSVYVSGDTALVGAWLDDDKGGNSGSAYVFQRDQGGVDNWGEVTKLLAADGAANDYFGFSVSVSGDTAVVGAWCDDDNGSDSGSAYVFQRDQGGVDNWGEVTKLLAADGLAGNTFGYSVSISSATVVVGAHGDDDNGFDSGSAYVFDRNWGGADNWGEVKRLLSSDGAGDDYFGCHVSISGDTLVVGAYWDDDNGSNSGSAYVFQRDQGGADNWGEVTKLLAADGAADDEFGYSVSVSGDTAVVGAELDDEGSGINCGSAYVFQRDQGGVDNWGEVAKLLASGGATDDCFGRSVAISGDTAVVGAYLGDGNEAGSGSAYVFDRNAGGADNWGEVTKLLAADGAAFDWFGESVSVSGDTVVVGANRDADNGGNSGSAYILGGNWPPTAVDDAYGTDEDTAFTTGNVLTNDTDPEGDTLSLQSIDTTGTLGQVTNNTDGTFDYDPTGAAALQALAVGESTDDTFTYAVSDGNGPPDMATVTITVNGVNDPPTADDDDYPSDFVTDEDTTLTENVISVLDNDTDTEGDTLTVSAHDATSAGGATLTVSVDGTFTYDPSGAAALQALAVGESTSDTFTYTADDGNGGTDTATVTITVNGLNDPPTAVDDAGAGFETDEDTAFTTGNVLANDADVDATDILFVVVLDNTGTTGQVSYNMDGTFDYDPNGQFEALAAGDSATDTFTYTITDGNGGTDTATVTITVTGVDEPGGGGGDGGGCAPGAPGAGLAFFVLIPCLALRRRAAAFAAEPRGRQRQH